MQYDAHADVPIPAQKKHIIRDVENIERLTIDYNPEAYSTCEAAAKAFHEALRKVVAATGQNPDIECGIFPPEKAREREYGNNWVVWWEAGPYEWAICASLEFMFNRQAGWYTEPYYSFDLCFTDM